MNRDNQTLTGVYLNMVHFISFYCKTKVFWKLLKFIFKCKAYGVAPAVLGPYRESYYNLYQVQVSCRVKQLLYLSNCRYK